MSSFTEEKFVINLQSPPRFMTLFAAQHCRREHISSRHKPLKNQMPKQAPSFRFKHYPTAFLRDDSRTLNVRMKLIERVTRTWPGATHFRKTPGGWLRCCRYVPGRRVAGVLATTQLMQICQQLDAACAEGLVHGDVHRKNILIDEACTMADLVDWEPSLRQLRDGRAVWVCTPGWQDPEDIACRRVSVQTDLLGVWRLATGVPPDFFHLPEWAQIKKRCLKSATPFNELLYILGEKQ